jgi:hypothetical protein
VKMLKWILLLAGIGLFAVSFVLPAIRELAKAGASPSKMYGYDCALTALLVPWGKDGYTVMRSEPLTWISVLISGWINPVFIISLFILLIKPRWRVNHLFRVLVPIMFVFCWIVFYKIHFLPYTGYWIWMAGTLTALFSTVCEKMKPARKMDAQVSTVA